ncbi:hypothetical protein Ahy_A10g050373 isoform A [Arachis hypogaea]|uniref:Uncharacterized protein n=1 Tax=Arachis hypogaea TaxID=3818 RepID=A0A445B977_ARAHY|nr:hypothetical protein Ahy_A10g050373 isoform A [Arachis hypogaea]
MELDNCHSLIWVNLNTNKLTEAILSGVFQIVEEDYDKIKTDTYADPSAEIKKLRSVKQLKGCDRCHQSQPLWPPRSLMDTWPPITLPSSLLVTLESATLLISFLVFTQKSMLLTISQHVSPRVTSFPLVTQLRNHG